MISTLQRNRLLACLVSLLVWGAGMPAFGVELGLQRKSAEEGFAKVCVVLDSEGREVAGTQNDLRWDPECASLEESDCAASPHHGKPLHGSIPKNDPSTYRSLVFALDNVDPMKDGEIYCCKLKRKGDSDCCAVRLDRLGASDPQGVALETRAEPGEVCLVGGAAAPAAQVPAAAPGADTSSGLPGWLWMALFALLVAAILFFALRRA